MSWAFCNLLNYSAASKKFVLKIYSNTISITFARRLMNYLFTWVTAVMRRDFETLAVTSIYRWQSTLTLTRTGMPNQHWRARRSVPLSNLCSPEVSLTFSGAFLVSICVLCYFFYACCAVNFLYIRCSSTVLILIHPHVCFDRWQNTLLNNCPILDRCSCLCGGQIKK